MEVIYAPYTRDQHTALLADSSRSGFCQHARGRRHCPNPHPRQLRCYRSRSSLTPPTSTVPVGYSIDAIPADAQVGLALTINEKGQPENIQVVKSYSKFWDARVIDTVREFHFKPAHCRQPTHSRRHEPHRQHHPLNNRQLMHFSFLNQEKRSKKTTRRDAAPECTVARAQPARPTGKLHLQRQHPLGLTGS